MIQDQLLKLLALTAMEEPISFNPDDLRGGEGEGPRRKLPENLSTTRPEAVHRRLAGRGTIQGYM